MLDGVERDSFHDLHLTEAFNIAGRCPVLTVPVGRGESGVPIGDADRRADVPDASVMAVSAACQPVRPWPWSQPRLLGAGWPRSAWAAGARLAAGRQYGAR